MIAALSGAMGAFAPSSPASVLPTIMADQLPSSRLYGARTSPVTSPSTWLPLSITACRFPLERGRPRLPGFIDDVPVLRHVPVSQPSPVVSLTTARVEMTTLPARRTSALVEVPRQTAFVMRNVLPPLVQVRLCERV